MVTTKTREKLKVLRVKAEMTQEQLASKSGVSARSIILYEMNVNNLRKAHYSTLEKIANALGVKVDDIFLG
ncbi:transcriptional regulator with XRE-family HTH domain [Alkalibacillus salilacus]|uniref:Transcriptional regulator with XRE-family HTH domain n=1 Tax=Alkalibacillus salilacus TaxID=284582 RepID=A0ABT9VDH3_9BACI|nr:transcriptional regulator with XRE-family HTH domain [Alkalibacillus salilacus]